MKLQQYQVDAFTDRIFGGNPAAVVPLASWLDDSLLQAIAEENNLSETAFFVPSHNGFSLRWFTPLAEVELCAHATLAAAHVIFVHSDYRQNRITFTTRSGELTVERSDGQLQMDFPACVPKPCELPDLLYQALGQKPVQLLAADDYLAVFDNESKVRAVKPDQGLLSKVGLRGVIITAPGDTVDFVSRFFAPKLGIPEDPVTGSTHCALAPFWAERFSKSILTAKQLSRRGGDIICEVRGDRVRLTGSAVTFMEAEIHL